jgi:hypothetical protein
MLNRNTPEPLTRQRKRRALVIQPDIPKMELKIRTKNRLGLTQRGPLALHKQTRYFVAGISTA